MSTQPQPRYYMCWICSAWHEQRQPSVCANQWVKLMLKAKTDAKKEAK